MQYVLVAPDDIAISSSIMVLPKLKRKYQIRDFDGKVLGSITEYLAKKTIHAFEDDRGNKLGETRYGSKAGWNRVKISIYDSFNEPRGNITGGAVNSNCGIATYPAYALEDALGQPKAITDPFTIKTPRGHTAGVFENLRKDGLSIRAPDGNIVATLKAGSTFDAIQIDLFSSSIDQLSILCLIMTVIWMKPYDPGRK